MGFISEGLIRSGHRTSSPSPRNSVSFTWLAWRRKSWGAAPPREDPSAPPGGSTPRVTSLSLGSRAIRCSQVHKVTGQQREALLGLRTLPSQSREQRARKITTTPLQELEPAAAAPPGGKVPSWALGTPSARKRGDHNEDRACGARKRQRGGYAMRPESHHPSRSNLANPKDTMVPAERQPRCRSKTLKRAEARFRSMAGGQYPAPSLQALNSVGGPRLLLEGGAWSGRDSTRRRG